MRAVNPAFLVVAAASLSFAVQAATVAKLAGPSQADFDKVVKPVLGNSCVGCHNDRTASGELNIAPYMTTESLTAGREGWEKILRKMKTGEMPPKGIPKPPPAQIDALAKFVEGEFSRADKNLKPDPGRVTARRLNRNEYSNTIATCWQWISTPNAIFRPTIPVTASTTSATC